MTFMCIIEYTNNNNNNIIITIAGARRTLDAHKYSRILHVIGIIYKSVAAAAAMATAVMMTTYRHMGTGSRRGINLPTIIIIYIIWPLRP